MVASGEKTALVSWLRVIISLFISEGNTKRDGQVNLLPSEIEWFAKEQIVFLQWIVIIKEGEKIAQFSTDIYNTSTHGKDLLA